MKRKRKATSTFEDISDSQESIESQPRTKRTKKSTSKSLKKNTRKRSRKTSTSSSTDSSSNESVPETRKQTKRRSKKIKTKQIFMRHFKMASSSKRSCWRFTAEEVAQIILNDESDNESNADSETGGLSSEEEFELDQELEEKSQSETSTG